MKTCNYTRQPQSLIQPVASHFSSSRTCISSYNLEIVDTSAAYRSLQSPPRPNTQLDGGYISIFQQPDTLPHNIIRISTFRSHATGSFLAFDHPPVFIIEWPRPPPPDAIVCFFAPSASANEGSGRITYPVILSLVLSVAKERAKDLLFIADHLITSHTLVFDTIKPRYCF